MMNQQLNTMQRTPIKFLDVCSGIGTTRIALERNGWECVGRFENDPMADGIYQFLFGSSEPNFGDVTQIPKNLPNFDVLVAGIAGNSFSKVWHKNSNVDNQISLAILQLLERFRPKGFILECVCGFADEKKNPFFQPFLHMLHGMGYDVQQQVSAATTYGLPVATQRLLLTGLLGKLPRDLITVTDLSIVKLKDCLIDTRNRELNTDGKVWKQYLAKQGLPTTILDCYPADYTIIDRRQTDLRIYTKGICPTLRKGNHGLFYVKDGHIKRITAYEGLLLHGVPKHVAQRICRDYPISDKQLLLYVGTIVPVPMLEAISNWLGTVMQMSVPMAA